MHTPWAGDLQADLVHPCKKNGTCVVLVEEQKERHACRSFVLHPTHLVACNHFPQGVQQKNDMRVVLSMHTSPKHPTNHLIVTIVSKPSRVCRSCRNIVMHLVSHPLRHNHIACSFIMTFLLPHHDQRANATVVSPSHHLVIAIKHNGSTRVDIPG